LHNDLCTKRGEEEGQEEAPPFVATVAVVASTSHSELSFGERGEHFRISTLDIIASALLVDVCCCLHFLHAYKKSREKCEKGREKSRGEESEKCVEKLLGHHVYRLPLLQFKGTWGINILFAYPQCRFSSSLSLSLSLYIFAPSAAVFSLPFSLFLSLCMCVFASIIVVLFSFLKIMCVLLPDRDQHKMLQAELFFPIFPPFSIFSWTFPFGQHIS